MIDEVLSFLKDQLHSYLRVKTAGQTFDVLFVEDRQPKEISLKENAVSTLLVNLEEERVFRAGSVQATPLSQGSVPPTFPHLSMNLYVLFVPHFSSYRQTLKFLSLVIQFFQSHRVFDATNAPSLSPRIEKLILELVYLPFSEQRDLWTGLGLSYMPSVVYKVKMVVFTDDESIDLTPVASEPEVSLASR